MLGFHHWTAVLAPRCAAFYCDIRTIIRDGCRASYMQMIESHAGIRSDRGKPNGWAGNADAYWMEPSHVGQGRWKIRMPPAWVVQLTLEAV